LQDNVLSLVAKLRLKKKYYLKKKNKVTEPDQTPNTKNTSEILC